MKKKWTKSSARLFKNRRKQMQIIQIKNENGGIMKSLQKLKKKKTIVRSTMNRCKQ